MPDPRARRGIRHPWTALLTAAASAVLSGAASITAIGEWVADAPQHVLALLGFRPAPLTGLIRPPHATTIRLVLAAADGDALDQAIGHFLRERRTPASGRKAIAVDGKTLRGSRTTKQPAIALIAAMTHSGQVLAQRQIDGKSNEIPAFAPLLDGIDLTGAVITADALGNVAHALDDSQKRVKLPNGSDGPPGLPGHPFFPVPVPVPLPLVLASYHGQVPAILPMSAGINRVDPSIPGQDPIPPDPGTTRLLGPAEQKQFRTWLNSLTPGGFAGGDGPTNADNAYQLRIAGYPEREVPLDGHKRGLMVDGVRPMDGYLVEAKHVRDPDCTKGSFRSIERVNSTLAKPIKVDTAGKPKWDPVIDPMYGDDSRELTRYKKAMANPANSEIRGLEIVTNGKTNAAYWESMIAMNGVTGSARYVP